VRIIYSGLGEKADSVIKRIISTERREWIVVTSDREIIDHAWSMGSVPLSSETFLPFIEPADAGTAPHPDGCGFVKDGDEYEDEGCRKGNPWKPSKKERAVQRALAKL
jgi:hypothetical protein